MKYAWAAITAPSESFAVSLPERKIELNMTSRITGKIRLKTTARGVRSITLSQ